MLKLVFLRLTTLELIKVLCCGQDGGNWVMCSGIERDEERESEVGRYKRGQNERVYPQSPACN